MWRQTVESGGGGEACWVCVYGVKVEQWRHQDIVFCKRRDTGASSCDGA